VRSHDPMASPHLTGESYGIGTMVTVTNHMLCTDIKLKYRTSCAPFLLHESVGFTIKTDIDRSPGTKKNVCRM
jgi:hypothetical protein